MAQRIPFYVPLLIITIVCVGGVELFYRGVERFLLDPVIGGRKVAETAAEPGVRIPQTRTKPVDHSVITSRNLFGPPPQTNGESETAPKAEDLEATSLELVLMGTIGASEEGARAIILNKKDRKQEMYQVGDTVEGAEIRDIQRGKVILNVDDRDEMLDMSEAGQYRQGGGPPGSTSPPRARPSIDSPQQPIESIGGEVRPSPARVVRPTRRIVRPPAAAPPENVEMEEPAVEEPPQEEQGPEEIPEAIEEEPVPPEEGDQEAQQ